MIFRPLWMHCAVLISGEKSPTTLSLYPSSWSKEKLRPHRLSAVPKKRARKKRKNFNNKKSWNLWNAFLSLPPSPFSIVLIHCLRERDMEQLSFPFMVWKCSFCFWIWIFSSWQGIFFRKFLSLHMNWKCLRVRIVPPSFLFTSCGLIHVWDKRSRRSKKLENLRRYNLDQKWDS